MRRYWLASSGTCGVMFWQVVVVDLTWCALLLGVGIDFLEVNQLIPSLDSAFSDRD